MWVHIKKRSQVFTGLAYPESLTWLVSISLAPYSKSPHTISLSLSLFISYISLQNLTVGMLLRGLFILHPEFYYPLSKKFSHKYVRSIIENYSLSRKLKTAFSFLRLLKGSNLSKNYVYFRL